jgi:hypothetical protein
VGGWRFEEVEVGQALGDNEINKWLGALSSSALLPTSIQSYDLMARARGAQASRVSGPPRRGGSVRNQAHGIIRAIRWSGAAHPTLLRATTWEIILHGAIYISVRGVP